MTDAPKATTDDTAARVLREVLKTPAFREIIKNHFDAADPAAARELVRAAMFADPNFSLSVLAESPKRINFLVEGLVELGKQLANLPPKMADEFVANIADDLDAERFSELPRIWLPLLIHMVVSNPKALKKCFSIETNLVNAWAKAVPAAFADNPDMPDTVGAALATATDDIDFGEVREAVEAITASFTIAFKPPLEKAVQNPIVLANLVGMLPPLLNMEIELLGHALTNIEMPPEIVASAMFNTISALDAEGLGRALSATATLINQIHHGNYMLGGGEPRFQAVLTEFTDRLLSTLDPAEAAKATVALAEDAETLSRVFADAIRTRPELAVIAAQTLVGAKTALLSAAAELIEEFSDLPEETVSQIVQSFKDPSTQQAAGRVVTAMAGLVGRLDKNDPELIAELLSGTFSGADTAPFRDALVSAGTKLAQDSTKDPKALGAKINGALERFNQNVESRNKDGGYLRSVAGELDKKQLEQALKNGVDIALEALFVTADTGAAFLKAAAYGCWKMTVRAFGALKKKLVG
jgi:hypothetical protein